MLAMPNAVKQVFESTGRDYRIKAQFESLKQQGLREVICVRRNLIFAVYSGLK